MAKTYQYVPFGSFPMEDDHVEIMITMPDSEGNGTLYAEKPDATYGFKTAKLSYPKLFVTNAEGFTAEELTYLTKLIGHNLDIVLERLVDILP